MDERNMNIKTELLGHFVVDRKSGDKYQIQGVYQDNRWIYFLVLNEKNQFCSISADSCDYIVNQSNNTVYPPMARNLLVEQK